VVCPRRGRVNEKNWVDHNSSTRWDDNCKIVLLNIMIAGG